VRDIEHTVTAAIKAEFRSSGQTSVCANRIYVHKAIFDQFAELFTQEVRKFNLGPGFNEDTTHDLLIHQRAIDKVDEHVRDAVLKGAKVVTGGRKAPEVGVNFYEPAILIGMTEDMLLAKEETFGPVAALFSFETEEEVVGLANNSEVGLAVLLRRHSASYTCGRPLRLGWLGSTQVRSATQLCRMCLLYFYHSTY
jgi:succinate-semialdehyde dehydrogenase/glutarate-semialdehyde dehydrogenase